MRVRAIAIFVLLAAAFSGCKNSNTVTGPSGVVTPTVRFNVNGRVTSGGAPIAGAAVMITFGQVIGANVVKTDDQGRYGFAVVGTQISFEVRHPGFYPGFGFASLTFLETDIDLARAQQIVLGDTVSGAIGGSVDNFCNDNGFSPCQIYTLTAPSSGEIQIDLTWTDPVDMRLLVVTATGDASAPQAPRGHLTLRYTAAAGETYDIWLLVTTACKQFELTVKSVEPGD